MTGALLSVRDPSVDFSTYGQTNHVLHGVSLDVPEGSQVALVGESQLALHRDAAQFWRAHVEQDFGAARDGHRLARRRHLARGPCRGVRPLHGPRYRGRGGQVHRHVGVIPAALRRGAGTHRKQQNRRNKARANEQAKLFTHDRISLPGTISPSYILGLRRTMKRVILFAKRPSGERRKKS